MKKGNNEGSVYKRKDGKWVAAVTAGWENGRRQRRTAVTRTRREAGQRLADLQKSLEQGLGVDADKISVADVLARWLESAEPSLRPRTFISYQLIVNRHLAPNLGRILLKKLTSGDIDLYIRRAGRRGLSNRTVQYHHAVLRRGLGWAEKHRLIGWNVARLVTPPTVEQHDVQPLTPAQARQFLSGVQGDRLAALYAVSLSLGLRLGECLGLAWSSVDLDAKTEDGVPASTLTVRHTLQRYRGAVHLDPPKTKRSRRTISLPAPLVEALRRHRVRQNEERLRAGPLWVGEAWNLVFTNEIGEPLSGPWVTRTFQQRLAALGLPKQRFHDTRHAAASFLIAQGVPLRVVMEILGHSTITTTANVYGHILPAATRDATDRVAGLLFKTS